MYETQRNKLPTGKVDPTISTKCRVCIGCYYQDRIRTWPDTKAENIFN